MDIRPILLELCAAFNAHDLDRIMELFADECVLDMPRGPDPWGSRYEGKARHAGARRRQGGAEGFVLEDRRVASLSHSTTVIPAKAGIQDREHGGCGHGLPPSRE